MRDIHITNLVELSIFDQQPVVLHSGCWVWHLVNKQHTTQVDSYYHSLWPLTVSVQKQLHTASTE